MASQDRWVFRRGVLWSANLKRRNTSVFRASIKAEFTEIDSGEIADLTAAAGQMDPISPEAIARRFALGRRCFAMRNGDVVAAYGWLTPGPEWVGELERELQVVSGEGYVWDCATVPQFRRKRLFGSLVGHMTESLRREGLERLWIIAVITAPPIDQGLYAAGFQPAMGLTYGRLLARRVLFIRPLRGATASLRPAASRLLRSEKDSALGPFILGNSVRPTPPDTHVDH
jgi:hypothetical protein